MGRPTGGFLRIFPKNVEVWYYVVVNVGQKKLFFFLRTIAQVEVEFNNRSKFRNYFSTKSSHTNLENIFFDIFWTPKLF